MNQNFEMSVGPHEKPENCRMDLHQIWHCGDSYIWILKQVKYILIKLD